ncbi:MAG: hypothetical protein D6732_21280 [Methanobacteriota archaeon]|nr:MAG: hypothetical protein D6732_21280 [Euryarchaeota archaeon]
MEGSYDRIAPIYDLLDLPFEWLYYRNMRKRWIGTVSTHPSHTDWFWHLKHLDLEIMRDINAMYFYSHIWIALKIMNSC